MLSITIKRPLLKRLMQSAVCATFILSLGCASFSASKSFDNVAQQTNQRIGKRVQWNTNSAADAEVQSEIESLLQNELTPDTAVQIALINNRELQAVYEELGVSQAQLVDAGLLRNPVFDGSYKEGISGTAGHEIEATVLFDFLSLVFLPMERSIAKTNLAAAEYQVTGAVLDLAGEVQRQFLKVQSNEQLLEMLRQVVKSTDASLDVAERLHKAGNIDDLKLENEQVMHSNARLELAQTEVEAMKDRERLISLLGLWGPLADQVKVPEHLPELPPDEAFPDNLEQKAVQANVDLEFGRKKLEALAEQARLTNFTSWLPELEAGGAFTREAEGEKFAGPSISLPIPILNWGQAKRARARAELRRAANEHYARAVEVRSAARVTLAQFQAARERARFNQDVLVKVQDKRLHSTMLQYNAMQLGPFELLQAKNDSIRSGEEYIRSLRDYWLAKMQLDLLLSGKAVAGESLNENEIVSQFEKNSMNQRGH